MALDGLREVAEHLGVAARSSAEHRDAFARSAFNRMYYAMYLDTRDLLRTIGYTKNHYHKELPDRLRNQVAAHLKTALQRSKASPRMQSQVQDACKLIAQNLELGYDVRVVADYEPEQFTITTDSDHQLSGITLRELKNRRNGVAASIGKVKAIWSQIQAQ